MQTKFALPLRTAAAVSLLLAVILISSFAYSQSLVISEVYGGGGNSGATYKNDFIEIFNRGTSPVSLAGWSVQYASSSGSTWSVTLLSGVIAPGQYYLVQEAAGSGGTAALPMPDASGSINMSATAGKVALVNGTSPLNGTCPTATDFVGFGGANCFEGAGPTAALTNSTAALRKNAGCTETNNNNADFSPGAPTPRNSASPANGCPTSLPPGGTGSTSNIESGDTALMTVAVTSGSNPPSTGLGVTVDLSAISGPPAQPLYDDGATGGDATAGDNVFSYQLAISAAPGTLAFPATITDAQGRSGSAAVNVKVVAPVPPDHRLAIHDIQGGGDASPYATQRIETEGIVTFRKSNGFFVQSPEAEYDGDPNTSEGIFVFTSSAPPASAQVGNRVKVIGTVQEYSPSADLLSPPMTEIGAVELANVLTTGNPLPSAITLTAADLPAGGKYNQLEKYEGMRVHVDSLTATGPTEGSVTEASATSSSYGTFDGVLTGVARPFREEGIEDPDPIPSTPPAIPRFDANPERLRVDTSYLAGGKLEVSTGAVVTSLTGPLDYQYRTYMIDAEPSSGAAIAAQGMSLTPARMPDGTEFTVATMNLERFFDTANDPAVSDVVLTAAAFANRLNKVSLAVRDVLHLPDIIGVEEMENLDTLTALANAINGISGAGYQAFLKEGNDVGGIDVGFLVKSTINVADVQQYGKDDHNINPATGQPYLVSNPPVEDVLNDRPPLVLSATVAANGQILPLCVVVNHLRSLSDVDNPTDDRVRQKRLQEAQYLAQLVASLQPSQACGGNVISVGDYNAYEVNDGYVDVMGTILGTADPNKDVVSGTLTPTGLTDLAFTLPAEQRYSYVFDGTAQVLDHILVTAPMALRLTEFGYVHNNADFPESLRNLANSPQRYSDHDIGLAYFALPVPPPTLHLPSNMTAEATSPSGAVVTYSATADSGGVATDVTCSPASGFTFPLGLTTVSCSSADARGNKATGSFTVTVQDTTPPLVTVTGVSDGAFYAIGNVPQAGCSASDAVSGVAVQPTVAVSGGPVGSFAATCSGAQDGAGNVTPPVAAHYTVGYNFGGFLAPVGNVIKAGSTVPLKWTLSDASGNLLGNLGSITSIKIAPSDCSAIGSPAMNASATGGTSLRFDPLTGQFNFNWSTKGLAPACYGVLVGLDDTTTRSTIVTIR